MKVGDYVRYVKWKYKENTKDIRIAKIKDIQEDTGFNQKFIFFENGNGEYEDYIIKSSPNIIDLIEVGDYVNGYKVIDFMLENGKTKGIIVDADIWGFDIDEIKSIVTKEQFESMEYKVKE